MVATATLPIEANAHCSPMVWTRDFAPVATRRVYLVCSQTRAGRDSLRVYPLQKKREAPPPLWCLVSPAHRLAGETTSHVILRWENMVLLRPLVAIFYRARWALARQDLFYPEDLLRLVKHAFLTDRLSEAALAEAEEDMRRIAALLALAEEGRGATGPERTAAARKAVQVGWGLLNYLKEEIGEGL